MTSDREEWLHRLRRALRPEIRPDDNDQRWGTAAVNAYANGWTVDQLADAIHARGYNGLSRPILVAIMRLEQLASGPPSAAPKTVERRYGCHQCHEGWIDEPAPQYTALAHPCPTCGVGPGRACRNPRQTEPDGDDDSPRAKAIRRARIEGRRPEAKVIKSEWTLMLGRFHPERPGASDAHLQDGTTTTMPCPVCRPEQHAHVLAMPPLGQRVPVASTIREPIPADWLKERRNLLNELMRTPDLTEDQREQQMADLIARQRTGHG